MAKINNILHKCHVTLDVTVDEFQHTLDLLRASIDASRAIVDSQFDHTNGRVSNIESQQEGTHLFLLITNIYKYK